MCHRNKQAHLAYKQARLEARCAARSARYNKLARPIIVYERKPGLVRMIVEHFPQRQGEQRGVIQQVSTYGQVPQVQMRGTVKEEYGARELEGGQVDSREVRREELPANMGVSESMELPSYGQAMKQG